MDSEQQRQEDDFYTRLDQWISRQGVMFQLTNASGLGSMFTKICGLLVRLAIVAFIALVILWFYLSNRPTTEGFREDVESQILTGLKAGSVKIDSISREKGGLLSAKMRLSNLEIGSSDQTFFEDWFAHDLTPGSDGRKVLIEKKKHLSAVGVEIAPLGIGDGLFNDWSGRSITLSRLDCKIKIGGEDDAKALSSYRSLFNNYNELGVKNIQILNANLLWGYGKVSKGSIKDAHIIATRNGDSWTLTITGGEFSHGWLQHARIIKMSVALDKSGEVVIDDASFRIGGGELELFAKIKVTAEPEVVGKFQFKGVDVLSLVGNEYQTWLDGSVAGAGEISGNLNSLLGLKIVTIVKLNSGRVVDLKNDSSNRDSAEQLAAKLDQSTLFVRGEFPIFKLMRTIDPVHNYKHLKFDRGSFEITQQGGDTRVGDINIRVGNFMIVKGAFDYAWSEEQDEIDAESGLGEMSDAHAASPENNDDDEDEEKQWVKNFAGELKLGLLGQVFDRHPKILVDFPVDESSQRVWLPLKMKGPIKRVTYQITETLEAIMKNAKKEKFE